MHLFANRANLAQAEFWSMRIVVAYTLDPPVGIDAIFMFSLPRDLLWVLQ